MSNKMSIAEKLNLNINNRIASRAKVEKKQIRNASKTLVSTVVTILVFAAVVVLGHQFLNYFLHHPDFEVKKVQVLNNITISPRKILDIAQIGSNENIYAASLRTYVKRLEKHPDIKTAVIKRCHPDKLVIKVIEREPAAVVMLEDEDNDVPIDNEGVILSKNKMRYALELPKIIGIKAGIYRTGTVITDERILTALKFADTLKHVERNTFIDIEKIYLDKSRKIVFKTASVEEIIIGTEWNNNQVARLVAVVEDLRFQRVNAQRIDLRFKDVAVIPKPM